MKLRNIRAAKADDASPFYLGLLFDEPLAALTAELKPDAESVAAGLESLAARIRMELQRDRSAWSAAQQLAISKVGDPNRWPGKGEEWSDCPL